jgi:hypothetical protein
MSKEIKLRRIVRSESNIWNGCWYVDGRPQDANWKKIWQITLEFDDQMSADQIFQLLNSGKVFLSDGVTNALILTVNENENENKP